MRIQAELTAAVLGFVALNLLLVAATIGLFVRMGPAIEQILLRNDATIVAAEDILEVLARTPTPTVGATDRQRIAAAIALASNNVTEDGESRVIEAIKGSVEPALSGNLDSRAALVDNLNALITINRDAMRRVDQEAQRLGKTGAWIAAILGLASVGLCLLLSQSLGNRVVRPILELRQVLVAAEGGDRFRRCTTRRGSPELREAMISVNQLLDARSPATDENVEGGPPPHDPGPPVQRGRVP